MNLDNERMWTHRAAEETRSHSVLCYSECNNRKHHIWYTLRTTFKWALNVQRSSTWKGGEKILMCTSCLHQDEYFQFPWRFCFLNQFLSILQWGYQDRKTLKIYYDLLLRFFKIGIVNFFFFETAQKTNIWNESKSLQIQKSASMNSHKQMYWYETCSHRHSILQQFYPLHTINLTFLQPIK